MSYGGEQLLWLQEGGGTADGASKRDRSAGDSNDERGVKRAAEPSQAQGAPRKKATPGPRVKSRICQVVGCNIEYSSTHECRARACQTHCSALSVRLEGQDPEQQFRFCYQCHKFHELDAFRNPDGTLRPRHNCYQSQALRLDRRKKKDAAAKASKKKLDIAAVLEAQSGHIIDAVNRASNVAASNLILANVMEVMEVAKATQQTIANAQQRPYTHPSQQLPHTTKPGAAATAFAPAVSSFDPGFTASSSGAEGRVPGDHPSGPSRRASPLDLTAIDDKRRQRRATHVMGDAAAAGESRDSSSTHRLNPRRTGSTGALRRRRCSARVHRSVTRRRAATWRVAQGARRRRSTGRVSRSWVTSCERRLISRASGATAESPRPTCFTVCSPGHR